MIIFPYSTALTLARPPLASYTIAVLCIVMFLLQLNSSITQSLMYYPQGWNPLRMLTATLAHGSWLHLIGNLIFFLAFAPAVEIIIGNTLRYLGALLFIALISGIIYSLSTLGSTNPLPTLGLSGVVMGIIGLSAYLMPQARIRVFWWYIILWKTFYVPAWLLALIYIGLDAVTLFSSDHYGGINIVAHVSGGIAGYAFGYFWLRDRKEETREELAHEIKQMELQRHSRNPKYAAIAQSLDQQQQSESQQHRQQDKFLSRIYRLVSSHNDGAAVFLLMQQYDYFKTETPEYEALFKRIQSWGPSRTVLCIGRLIIQRLHEEKRYGRALYFIEKCQAIRPQFILPDLSQTLFYARQAIDLGKTQLALNLLQDPYTRYGDEVNAELCIELLAQIS